MSIYGLAATLVASVLSWCFVVKYYSEIIKLGYGTTSTAAEIGFADGVYIHWSRVWTIVDLIYLSFYFLLTIPICRAATKPSNRSNMDRVSVAHITCMQTGRLTSSATAFSTTLGPARHLTSAPLLTAHTS